MACPFIGNQGVMIEKGAGSNPHSFDTALESGSSLKKSNFEYGIDTDNFNHDFLEPDFNPVDMRKIVEEALLIAGGAVAILLQVANPGVGAGVNRHSNFAYRAEDRLRTTMTFVYCMAYGTPEEKKTIISMVHQAHVPVKGDGYAADDCDLQMWVAATLYATGVDVYEKVFGKFDEATADRIYDQYSVMASSLRVPPEVWPKNRAAFWEYWEETIRTFTITDDAKNVKKDLLYNKNYPLWVRMSMPLVRLATAEWLPEQMREPYGFKTHSRRRRIKYKMLNAVVQSTYPNLPKKWRQFPMNYYLKDMRSRMATNEHIIGNHGEKKV